jgi:hypothetical protein
MTTILCTALRSVCFAQGKQDYAENKTQWLGGGGSQDPKTHPSHTARRVGHPKKKLKEKAKIKKRGNAGGVPSSDLAVEDWF